MAFFNFNSAIIIIYGGSVVTFGKFISYLINYDVNHALRLRIIVPVSLSPAYYTNIYVNAKTRADKVISFSKWIFVEIKFVQIPRISTHFPM